MKLFLSGTVAVLLLGYLLFGGLLYLSQDDFLYYPTQEPPGHGYEVLPLPLHEVTLRLLVMNGGQQTALLYFGGNGENVVFSAGEIARLFPDNTVYLVNYRGYGGSTGTPSEAGLYADALSIYDTLKSRHRTLAVIGRSLGTGVATFLAAQRQVAQLALITPYDSIRSIAQQQFPMYPITFMLRDRYESIANVPQISAKTLILIAEQDEVIASANSQNLASAFPPGQAQTEVIPGTDHTTISKHPQYRALMRDFFAAYAILNVGTHNGDYKSQDRSEF